MGPKVSLLLERVAIEKKAWRRKIRFPWIGEQWIFINILTIEFFASMLVNMLTENWRRISRSLFPIIVLFLILLIFHNPKVWLKWTFLLIWSCSTENFWFLKLKWMCKRNILLANIDYEKEITLWVYIFPCCMVDVEHLLTFFLILHEGPFWQKENNLWWEAKGTLWCRVIPRLHCFETPGPSFCKDKIVSFFYTSTFLIH